MKQQNTPERTFHLTGQITGGDLFDIGSRGLRPALFSGYDDLTKFRHDFPLVLTAGTKEGACLRSLTDIVNEILREVAPEGPEGERTRQHLLRLEDEIRKLSAAGQTGTLSELWDQTRVNLIDRIADEDALQAFEKDLVRARAGLTIDGPVVGYSEDMPDAVVTHVWRTVCDDKSDRFMRILNDLVLRLSNILKADDAKSTSAFDAETLQRDIGASFEDAFDFGAMSDILGTAFVDGALPEKRRRRIASTLSTLTSQKFYPVSAGHPPERVRPQEGPHRQIFDGCAAAMDSLRRRLPEMVDLVKAMTIARLEIAGRYRDAVHDPFFAAYDERYLTAEDLALFPPCLVRLPADDDSRAGMADLWAALASGLPVKVLAHTNDVLGDPAAALSPFHSSAPGNRTAAMALGLEDVFVLQAGGGDLCRLGGALVDGMVHEGPALFNLFTGGNSQAKDRNARIVPPYLRAAAATEGRVFPVFVRDPGAGRDWEARFSVAANPQPERDWPRHRLDYADADLQRQSQEIAFTLAEVAGIDERYKGCFAGVPSSGWHRDMVPVEEFMDLNDQAAADKVPFILMVDDAQQLHRVIVEARLVEAAKRCRDGWRRLRELGGVENSHVRTTLAREKEIWDRHKSEELAELRASLNADAGAGAGPPETPAATQAAEGEALPDAADDDAAAAMPDAETAAASDAPYIETPRCTTCDECTQINNRMFAYDDNKQAHIADPTAGTFRQLVQAAESCQVAIIHPGKPLNPDEPGLDELLVRAEAFN